ncbi:MAG: UDP-2,4-diacetamido-2,4,6-trideoxy-beta-L-altropyranose hydrolase [Desulfobacteraceae bacterium]|nr:MAG: UDP-2,4-diacetamido-2,4,6-trideoxy-beta-L-altropyranose hydrolase [Desulfobacteraceae bacterium]
MKIIIRTDASIQIGTGHVMRCLALAEALRDRGADVHFICRALLGNLSAQIESRGFAVHALRVPDAGKTFYRGENAPVHAPWLEVDWRQDLSETLAAVKSVTSAVDWLVVDHYAIDHQWESGMREVAQRIMVIDDLADRLHDCDILLDQNYFENLESRYAGLVPENCRMLLGPDFALLRPEFRQARLFTAMRGNGIARVLIYFGGIDPENITRKALDALCAPMFQHLYIDVVVGPAYLYLEELKLQAATRSGVRIHVQPQSFVELLLRADLCIGAGGSSIWERLCLGLPSIVISIADNQLPTCLALNKKNLIIHIGTIADVDACKIENSIESILTNKEYLSNISKIYKFLVDGLGATRVCEEMLLPKE